MMLRILLLLSLTAAPWPVLANTILVVGDSLSAAYGMPVERGWVALLKQRITDERRSWQIINASISGDTTANARARLPQAISRHQPDIIVLELGGNDGLRGLSLTEMKQNLAAMIETAGRHDARVLLIGVQLPPNYGSRYTEKFHAVYHDLAQEHDVALVPSMVDGVGTHPELMQSDGIHPNVEAQPLIVERVWAELRPLLEDGDEQRSP